MWKRINDVSDTDTSINHKDMRYFIYYSPNKSIRLIDVSEYVLVEDVIKLIKKEFGLNIEDSGPSETSIILNYNGSDLKPKWSLIDLSIPSGSIIRCFYREEKAADLYIHCEFNKQILKLFDSSLTLETTISTIRKKISDKLGLPLSTFCLETYDTKQRLYDQMKLLNYDVKIHDHIYLKVWKGYEKFISACIKGFTESYSHDDLTKHYQIQIALYIAAFYGHMELANSVMQQGGRSDRPVGEHPSRQWSCESIAETLPEMLKCPIHIAIERGQVKMVDLFVRQSILCTQIRDPITGLLPYQLAISYSFAAKTKEEKQCYRVIYFYLHDKHFNLKIPLNSTSDYVLNLLTSTISTSAVHRLSSNLVYISLPLYCKIMNWYERAREKVWKKYGGHVYNISSTKRIYPKQGLLGYKVLIDGFNNTFDVPIEQTRNIKSDQIDIYAGFSNEEKEKMIKMKTFIKNFALDERKRAKQIAAVNLQQSRRPPLLFTTQTTTTTILDQNKSHTQMSEDISSSSEYSNNLKRPHTIGANLKTFKSILNIKNSSVPNRLDNNHKSNEINKRLSKTAYQTLSSIQTPIINEEEKPSLPTIMSPTSTALTYYSSLTNKIETVIDANKKDFQSTMSSVDAYALSSSRMALENEKRKTNKKRELLTQLEQSVQKQPQYQPEKISNSIPISFSANHKATEVETYIPLPDRPTLRRPSPIKSRLDIDIRQATVKPYERYASATTRATAIQCLQEAGYFKGKSWLKQVEISKEMVKHHVKRRIRRSDDDINTKPMLLPLRTNVVTTSATTHRSNTIKVN